MNWKLIGMLSGFGFAMGLLTVFVIPPNVEPVCWLAIFIFCAYMLAKQTTKPFIHGVLLGLANCVWITGFHVIFAETYMAGHPREAQMGGRGMMLVVGPIVGLISGVVIGFFAWIASKFVKPKAAPAGSA